MVRITLSGSKRYLSGIDWLIHALDYMTRKATGVGNRSQVILELSGSPALTGMQPSLERLIHRFPHFSGRVSRSMLTLAPYWRMAADGSPPPLAFRVSRWEESLDAQSALPLLEWGVNEPPGREGERILFHLLQGNTRSFAAMAFDHRLLDAWGAEKFLEFFETEREGRSPKGLPLVSVAEPHHLCQWGEKFEAGKEINRLLLRLARGGPPLVLPLPGSLRGRPFRFGLLSFDKTQTLHIYETAQREAGFLMLMPYLLAVSTWAIHKVFLRRGLVPGHYVVPVSIDMRPSAETEKHLFFNHMSMLWFCMDSREAEDFPALVATIRQQLYDQVKSGVLENLRKTSYLMRIAPMLLMDRLMRVYLKGQVASFCFAFLAQSGYGLTRFAETNVENLFHTPRAPVPPGLGIFFNSYQGRLNGVLSSLEGMLSDDETAIIHDALRSRLSP